MGSRDHAGRTRGEDEGHAATVQFVRDRERGFGAKLHIEAGDMRRRVQRREGIPHAIDRADDFRAGFRYYLNQRSRDPIIIFDNQHAKAADPVLFSHAAQSIYAAVPPISAATQATARIRVKIGRMMNSNIELDDYSDFAEERVLSVPQSLAGERLDAALASLMPDYSRSRLASWIKEGLVTVDGASATPKQKLWGGETLRERGAEPARRSRDHHAGRRVHALLRRDPRGGR